MSASRARDAVAESVRRCCGVAAVALRAAVRTRMVAALLVLLAACVTGLPRVLKGDGTPSGELDILLRYTLGFSFGLLCLATLWAACALFAVEIASQRMHLAAVKPVRAAEFWLGKWLALLALGAALLTAVYGGVYAQVRVRAWRAGWSAEQRPAGRRVARPLLPSIAEEARETYALMRQRGELPPGLGPGAALRVLAEQAEERYEVLNPGDEVVWKFRLARPPRADEPLLVRLRFDTEYSTREQVAGLCRLWLADRPERVAEVALADFTLNEIVFAVDMRALVNGGAAAGRDVRLAFRHQGDPARASALMMRFRKDVAVLTPGGSFEANLARSALAQLGVLALLAALGLTLSVCFSPPVAAFCATVLLVLALVSGTVVGAVRETGEEGAWMRVGLRIARLVHDVAGQATREEPLESLTRGELIEGRALLAVWLWNGALAPVVLAVFGCGVLRRRELAAGD